MTRRLAPFSEEYFHEGARAISVKHAKCLGVSWTANEHRMWTAGVNEKPDHVAHWIGDDKIITAYLITKPFGLPGLGGLEAVRGWVTEPLRKSGCFVELMLTAAGKKPLVSDQDGMTDMAHSSWLKARGFDQMYYDKVEQRVVSPACVPDAERFDERDCRWLLVLFPTELTT